MRATQIISEWTIERDLKVCVCAFLSFFLSYLHRKLIVLFTVPEIAAQMSREESVDERIGGRVEWR